MLRFLRQYNKWILAVGGTLLLVSWALSGTITSLSQYSARTGSTWATYCPDDTRLTMNNLEAVRQELNVLDVIERMFRQPLIPIPGADRDPAHWYLLTKEAEEAGLIAGPGDALPILQVIGSQMALEPDQVAASLASQSHTSTRVVKQTLAKIVGVSRLRDMSMTMPRFSDSRLKHAAVDTLLAAAADVVVLDARKIANLDVPPPTEEALQAHLAKYGKDEPGKGEQGFGYRLPDRMKIEWLNVSESAVRTAIQASDALNPLTLKKKFAEDPAKFGAPPPAPGSDPLASYPAYEASVRQKVLDELVSQKMAEISKFASDQLALAQRGLDRDGSYVKLPADWTSKKLDFRELGKAIGEQFKIAFPAYGSTGEVWMSVKDVEAIPFLGTASTTRYGQTPVRLGQLLAKLKEFGHGDDNMPVQQDVATPPLTATNRDLYFVRVIGTDPSREPASVDDVRPALVADVQAIARFEALAKLDAEIREKAAAKGLRDLATEYGATVEFASRLQQADQRALPYGVKLPGMIPGIGQDSEAMAAIIAAANKLPKGSLVTDVPEAERTVVITLPKKLSYLVVRITDLYPLTVEDFDSIASNPRAQDTLVSEGGRNAANDVFSLEALMKRHNFHLNREQAEGDEGQTAKS